MNLTTVRRQILKRCFVTIEEETPAGRLLATASDLFYREGIRAVGIDRLIDEAGIAKATFYAHYPSKSHLVAAYLTAWCRGWYSWLFDSLEPMTASPEDQMLRVFDVLEQLFRDGEYRGCAVANAIAELGQENPEITQIGVEHKERVKLRLEAIASHAGLEDPCGLAADLMLIIDGAMATAAREGGATVAERAKRIAQTLTSKHRPSTPA